MQIHAIALNYLGPLCVAHSLDNFARNIGTGFANSIVRVAMTHSQKQIFGSKMRPQNFSKALAASTTSQVRLYNLLSSYGTSFGWVPKSVTMDQASGVSLAALTAAKGIWYHG